MGRSLRQGAEGTTVTQRAYQSPLLAPSTPSNILDRMSGPEPNDARVPWVPGGTNKALTAISDLLLIDILTNKSTSSSRLPDFVSPGKGLATPPVFHNKSKETPKSIMDLSTTQGRHGTLYLRDSRKRSNRLLDMLINSPKAFDKINESVGGGLTSLLFTNRRNRRSSVFNPSL